MEITKKIQPYINDGTLPKGRYFKGTASGHGGNCLIDSVAQGVGIKTTKSERAKIRENLNVPKGALPNDRKIINKILEELGKSKTSVYFYSEPHKALDSFTCRHSQAKRIVLVYYTPGHFSPVIFEKETNT